MSRYVTAQIKSNASATADAPNAFLGKTRAPSPTELKEALGATSEYWNEMVQELKKDGITAEEWKGVYPNKYGWTLRLKQGSRNIVYMMPCAGCFRAAFVLSDRAMEAARATSLPQSVKAALESAPRYPEGNGVRLTVRSAKDLPAIRKLAAIKMAS